ncbi:MAG: hypothetical protein CVU87_00170 [Firmicutes bacterium HGW-Firmicutes-12]|jgi:predicted nucleic acid-binding Zn ribbon protein|nr:MAG: hypothetical protein CVU87_00170 [Firmicutes bacterium HGW-Firmicutes-12]
MPWCPNCKTEYREGFDICSDCAVELVDNLNIEEGQFDIYEDDKWCLLLQTQNEREADIVESFIKSSEIPVLRKEKGAGGYLRIYMGMNALGSEIYVPESRLVEASEIINLKTDEPEQKAEPKKSEVHPYVQKRKKRVWILFVIIPIIISLVAWLLEYTMG